MVPHIPIFGFMSFYEILSNNMGSLIVNNHCSRSLSMSHFFEKLLERGFMLSVDKMLSIYDLSAEYMIFKKV